MPCDNAGPKTRLAVTRSEGKVEGPRPPVGIYTALCCYAQKPFPLNEDNEQKKRSIKNIYKRKLFSRQDGCRLGVPRFRVDSRSAGRVSLLIGTNRASNWGI